MSRAVPLLLLLVACPRVNGDAARPATAVDAGTALAHAHIGVEPRGGQPYGLDVELALSDSQRERGLMFRKELADGAGMLFIFVESGPHNFWMKNTLIPLDMIFATDDGTVLGCVARAEPMTLTGRSVPGDSRYVLEVPGGWCADHKVAEGAHLLLDDTRRFKPE